jgi:DNA-binding NtrC family response regulator
MVITSYPWLGLNRTEMVPSLNERREDIVPIAKHFLVELSRKHQKNFIGIAPEAEDLLQNYTWRGNIRELRNIVERYVLIEDGPILQLNGMGLLKKNGKESQPPATGSSPFQTLPEEGLDLEALEKHFILEALKKAGGNSRRAANLLNMSYYSFRYKRKSIKDL